MAVTGDQAIAYIKLLELKEGFKTDALVFNINDSVLEKIEENKNKCCK